MTQNTSSDAPFPHSATAVFADSLHVSFGGVPVLHGITVRMPHRGITVLVGRSGSGKTTLLRAVNRLNECTPGCRTQGRLLVSLNTGTAISGQGMTDVYGPEWRDPAALRARMGMVFQTPDVLPVSIRRNLELPLRHVLGLDPETVTARIDTALRDAGLWNEVQQRLDTPATSLSGGQQQRLCLARALAMEPALLLLDEPTASLDTVSARTIEGLLSRLRETYPVIMVSHSLGQALRLADRLVLVAAGRIARCWDRVAEDGLPDVATLESMLETETVQEDVPCCT